MSVVVFGGNPDDVAMTNGRVVFQHPAVAWTDKTGTVQFTGVTLVDNPGTGASIATSGVVNGVQYTSDVIYPDTAGVYEFQKDTATGVVFLEVDGQTRLLRMQGTDTDGALIAAGISSASLVNVLATSDLGTNGGSVAQLTGGVLRADQRPSLSDATAQATADAVTDEVTAARMGKDTLLQAMNALGNQAQQPNSANLIRSFYSDTTSPVRPTGAQYWEVLSQVDPILQAHDGDRWGKITLSAPTGGGTTTLWNGWDPTSSTTPPDLVPYPDWTNTGVPPGTTLSNSGSIATSSNGQVIDALNVTGNITINHTGVTIKRCRIKGKIIKGSIGNDRSTKIWACEIHVDPALSGVVLVNVGVLDMARCNLYGGLDLYHPTIGASGGVQLVVRDNFFHDCNSTYDIGQDNRTVQQGYGTPDLINSHSDCIQIDGSSSDNYLIKHNTMYCWTARGFTGTLSDGTVLSTAETCTASMGPHWNDATRISGYAHGAAQSCAGVIFSGSSESNVTITNNRMIGAARNYYTNINVGATSVTVSNNRFGAENGAYPNTMSWNGNPSFTQTGNVRDSDGSALSS